MSHQYCSSKYGSQLWELNSNVVDNILSRWFKYHRVVLEVPNTTHCDMLPFIADRIPLRGNLDLKFISFYRSIVLSENAILKYTTKYLINLNISTMCRDTLGTYALYKINIDDILTMSAWKIRKVVYNKWFSSINSDYPIHANVIKDMLGIKEERYTRILSNEECNFFIEFLCTV